MVVSTLSPHTFSGGPNIAVGMSVRIGPIERGQLEILAVDEEQVGLAQRWQPARSWMRQ